MEELSINSLNYTDIRNNLITFLESQVDENDDPIYQDFNFQSSGISTLINLLAYNTHYIGYYVKMLLNESFIDSAIKKESLLSKAKMSGYLPRGKTSARNDIILKIDIDTNDPGQFEPSSRSILIPRGTSFSSQNNKNDTRIFYNIDDIFINNTDYNGSIITYRSDPFTIYEGKLQEWKFKINSSLKNQRYIIQDRNIDIDTIRMIVFPDGSNKGEEFFLSNNVINIDRNSRVYYLTTQEEGFYEIIFGNNIFGKMPANKSQVVIYYISSNGESGNGCKRFVFNKPSQDIPTENNIGNWEDFSIETNDVSSGGCEAETVEALRFNIPHHFRKQNRIVTTNDFKAVLLSEFRNISSMNIWGGEENYYKDYGKIYISVKPKFSDRLTLSAKNDISNRLLKKYCVVGMQPVFVDPEFINVEIEVYAQINNKLTNKTFGEIEKIISNQIIEYNNTNLNIFDNFLSEVDLMTKIKDNTPGIKSCYSRKELNKDQEIIYNAEIKNQLFIGNPILPGVKSNLFTYGKNECYFKDEAGSIYIFENQNNEKVTINSFGDIDYEKGIIIYEFPKFAKMKEKNYTSSGVINFRMKSVNPDIETYLQNIVRITKIRVILKNA